jgi:lipocalin
LHYFLGQWSQMCAWPMHFVQPFHSCNSNYRMLSGPVCCLIILSVTEVMRYEWQMDEWVCSTGAMVVAGEN